MKTITMNEIHDIVSSIVSKYPCIVRIGVFGSYARGDFDDTSGDILYDYNSDVEDFDEQVLDFVGDFLDRIATLKAGFVFFKNIMKKMMDSKENVLFDVVWVYDANEKRAVVL